MPQRASITLLAGLLLSLVLHVSILLPAMIKVMSSQPESPVVVRANFSSEDFETVPEEDSIQLGIDESTASSMTWIGYEDYEEHIATLAEVDQAAFQTTPTGSEPTPNVPSEMPTETPQEATEAPSPQESPPTPDPQPDPATSPDPMDELQAWLEATHEGEGPREGEPTQPDARAQAIEDMLEQLQQMMENPVETQQPQQTPKPESSDEAPPVQASPPQPAGQPGQQSDQESDATSTLDVTMEQLTLGRPLASHGLQIKPRKPVFTTLTMLTAVPANPMAELRFRRDGKPARVRLLEGSGDPRIDEAVLNSLYRWRAAGKKLRELEAGQTIPVRIRIMLMGPR